MMEQIRTIYKMVKKNDKGIGVVRDADIWEAGLRDGKTALDCQSLIATPDYAIRMVDFTLQCLAGGVNGIVYWDFDDAMHFMYSANSTTPKEWGMFSSLAGASSRKQELRPWYHSTCLLTHLFEKGNKIYSPAQNDTTLDNSFRTIGTVSQDGKTGGYVAVNAGTNSTRRSFYIKDAVEGENLYIYYFGKDTYRLGDDGFIEPNDVIEGSLNKRLTLTIPGRSAVIISNTRL